MDDQEDLFADLYDGDDDAQAPAPTPTAPVTAPVAASAPEEEQPEAASVVAAAPAVTAPAPLPVQNSGYGDANDASSSAQRQESSYEDRRERPVQLKDDGKMFIGGLNWETTDVMRDGNTGRSRGFGFLRFEDPKVVNVVAVKEHVLDGKLIDPKRAIPRDEQEKTSKIFVGGVSQDATEKDFKEFFEQFGRVLDATLMMDKDTGRPRGFGFVTFDSDSAVDRTLEGSLEILGKAIEVKRAQPRNAVGEEESSGRGGRFGSRGRGGAQNNFGGGNVNQAQQLPAQGAAPNNMTPAQMAQYMMQMQNMLRMAAMQNNPQMQQMMAMQQNPMLMQQMMAMQQNGGNSQSNTPVNGGPQGNAQQGNPQQSDNYERQQQARMQQSNFNQGAAWEGMYDDEAPPGSRGGRNNRGGATPNAPFNAPINAPTGPRSGGGGGRGNYRGVYKCFNNGKHTIMNFTRPSQLPPQNHISFLAITKLLQSTRKTESCDSTEQRQSKESDRRKLLSR
ncbi:hypothetical protein MRB53_041559 [Persea americana]|nr:hypothetical protein MRB53_041559 [Persea americana]